jgi:hypothetical protein
MSDYGIFFRYTYSRNVAYSFVLYASEADAELVSWGWSMWEVLLRMQMSEGEALRQGRAELLSKKLRRCGMVMRTQYCFTTLS